MVTKTLGKIILGGIVLSLFLGTSVLAASEKINDFSVEAIIQPNGQVLVTETITYDFSTNKKHGIFRDIPLFGPTEPSIDLEVLKVTEPSGKAYEYEEDLNDGAVRIKVGDPDTYVSGIKTYVINYQVNKALRSFEGYDEFYWNATGDGWEVPINHANIRVTWPELSFASSSALCFTGYRGSEEKDCAITFSETEVRASSKINLEANQGLTVVVGLPPGYIENVIVPGPAFDENSAGPSSGIDRFVEKFIPVVMIMIVVITVFVKTVLKSRRKPKPVIPRALKKEPVVVAYEPPADLAPIEVGTILDRTVDITDISSVMIDLAVRGYIKINYLFEEKKFWFDSKEFELVKLKDLPETEYPAAKLIFDFLFKNQTSIKLSELENYQTTFQALIKKIKTQTRDTLLEKNYFDKKSDKLATILIPSVVLISCALFVVTMFLNESLLWPVVIITLGIFACLRYTKTILTSKGLDALRQTLGFQEFLSLTETDRLKRLNDPSLKPETFEKFLAYAMVLGVEKEWAKTFEGLYVAPPTWYGVPGNTHFSTYLLMDSLTNFDKSFNHVFAVTSPKSSSGFGGGSSGGGFGGGGGGSW